jgi:hypothetical protein
MAFSSAYIISQFPKKSEIITLNGANIYYEVYGRGDIVKAIASICVMKKQVN